MKLFIVLALCLSAVVAEELHDRGVDFHTLHYSQHHQTVEEAKKKIAGIYDGQQAEFEEVGSYGGVGGAGVGTVGLSSSGLYGSEYGSSSGGSAQYSSSAASNFGASHSANFASSSSSSIGSNAHFGSAGSLGGGSVVIPVAGGSGSSSYLESSAAENVQQIVPEILVSGGAGGHESYLRHEEHRTDKQAATPLIYSSPSGGSEKYYHHEERRVSSAATPSVYSVPSASSGSEKYLLLENRRAQTQTSVPVIQFAPSSGGSENYVHHEERRVQSQAVPIIHYTSPSGSSENYLHIKSERVQQAPVQLVVSSPAGGQESFLKYRKVTTSASQPQVLVHTAPSTSSSYVHHSSTGSTSGSQLGHLVTGGLTGISANLKTGFYGDSGFTAPSTSFATDSLTSGNSNSLLKTGYGTSHHAASDFGASSAFGLGRQSTLGTSGAYTDRSSFGSQFGTQSKFGSSFGSESKFGSQFGAESAFGSGSSFGTASSSSGLNDYMLEARRLAEMQAHGMSVGSTRTSGSQFDGTLGGTNTASFSGLGGIADGGIGGSGYKAKSWEKSSKWSSQSEFGPDGKVNNYKELSTGESENYDINGHRAGFRAATSTLDDNGKVSSYSLHT